MTKQWLILLLLFAANLSFAQNAYRDSLKTVYKNQSLSDSARLGALHELAYFPENPDTAWYYIGLLKNEASKKEEPLWLARVQLREGFAYESEKKYPEAIKAFHQAKTLYEQSLLKIRGHNICLAEIYGVYNKMELADSAAFYYQKLDSIYHTLPGGEYKEKYWVCHDLAVNVPAGETELNLQWRLEGLKSLEKFGTDRQLMEANSWIGYLMAQLGYDEEVHYTGEALRLATKLDDKQQMVSQNSRLSLYYQRSGDLAKATDYQLRAFEVRSSTGNHEEKLQALFDLSLFYYDNALYAKGLATANKLLLEADQIDDKYRMMRAYEFIGTIYEEVLEDYEKALVNYKEATKLSLSLNDTTDYAYALMNEGAVHMYLKEYQYAEDVLSKGLEIATKHQAHQALTMILLRLGLLHQEQGQSEQALSFYKQALIEASDFVGWDQRLQTDLNARIGNSYITLDQFTKALPYCLNAHKIALNDYYIEGKRNSCNCLYRTYDALGDQSKALVFLKEVTLLNDTIAAREASKKIQRMEFMKQLYNDSLAAFESEHQLELAHQEEIHQEQQNRNRAYGGAGLALLLAGGFYSRWRYVNKSKRIIEREKERSENLLLNILPAEVAEELKEKGESDAKDFDDITVLFTDFQGFTQTAAGLSAKELVGEINACFKQFDIIMEKYGIEKIKTIGDAYMAAGGLHIPRISKPKDVVQAALEMQQFILNRKAKLKPQNLPYFNMRAGIHTGPVVAGIVGVKKFQYDIWGDTVNTASRMESNGEVGKVNISNDTYELLKHDFQFTFESRGKVDVKGKGEMQMWFVNLKEDFGPKDEILS